MASIAEWIEKIKTAIYGEEVRGAIWQSLDAMNTQVDAINVDSAQIEQNKTDIATNTAAITALNSSLGGWKIVRHRTSAAMPSAGEYIIPYPNGEGYSTVYGILAATIVNGGYCLPFPPLTTSDSPSFNNSYAISMRLTQAGIAIYTGGGWGAESKIIDFFLICKV